MVGELPADFLRLGGEPASGQNQQINSDYQTAQMLQAQQAGFSFTNSTSPRLSITLVQVKHIHTFGNGCNLKCIRDVYTLYERNCGYSVISYLTYFYVVYLLIP